MPKVTITVNEQQHPALKERAYLISLADIVRGAVVKTLYNECLGDLGWEEVEVEIRTRHEWRHIGGEKYGVQIIVVLNDYPDRRTYIQQRTKHLSQLVKKAMPDGITGYVWVQLVTADFREF